MASIWNFIVFALIIVDLLDLSCEKPLKLFTEKRFEDNQGDNDNKMMADFDGDRVHLNAMRRSPKQVVQPTWLLNVDEQEQSADEEVHMDEIEDIRKAIQKAIDSDTYAVDENSNVTTVTNPPLIQRNRLLHPLGLHFPPLHASFPAFQANFPTYQTIFPFMRSTLSRLVSSPQHRQLPTTFLQDQYVKALNKVWRTILPNSGKYLKFTH